MNVSILRHNQKNVSRRYFSSNNRNNNKSRYQQQKVEDEANSKMAQNIVAIAVLVFGVSYASVPLYKLFCRVTGFGGTTQRVEDKNLADLVPVESGESLRIYFDSNVHRLVAVIFVYLIFLCKFATIMIIVKCPGHLRLLNAILK